MRNVVGEASLLSSLQPGDEIVAVNDVQLTGMSRQEAWTLLKSLADGQVRLVIRR